MRRVGKLCLTGERKGCDTVRLVRLLSLKLHRMVSGGIGHISEAKEEPTEPVTAPSWADFPLTVKLTPLGALDLTSRLAGVAISLRS